MTIHIERLNTLLKVRDALKVLVECGYGNGETVEKLLRVENEINSLNQYANESEQQRVKREGRF